MILFFTDGNIDFSVVHREDGLAEEAAATSRQQADTATADAVGGRDPHLFHRPERGRDPG